MGTPSDQSPHSDIVRRAALPEILFILDLALALQLSEEATKHALLRGECGPYFRVGGQLAVLRDSLLDALAARERRPMPRPVGESTPNEAEPEL